MVLLYLSKQVLKFLCISYILPNVEPNMDSIAFHINMEGFY